MSIHINAKPGEIAETVLFPGDPLRAKYIAENFLHDAYCYNTVRNMLGFTGRAPDGKLVSVQGSGMGMASLSIYAHELVKDYGAKNLIRVGSAGSLQEEISCRSIILAQGSCSDSAMNNSRFRGMSFAPICDWDLLLKAYIVSKQLSLNVKIGNVFATDHFYGDNDSWKIFAAYSVLAVEMESAELYTLAAAHKFKALSILTISDNLVTGERLSHDERERTFSDMINIALAI